MLTIDTHCHTGAGWFEPIETMLFHMDKHGVDRATLIQHWGQFDNSYLLDCARRFPGRFAAVGMIDGSQPDAPETLARWAKKGMEGIRLTPAQRSPGKDPLAIWRKAAELGLVVSCHRTPDPKVWDQFRPVIEAFPNLKIIIEHLGLPDMPTISYHSLPQTSHALPSGAVQATTSIPEAYAKVLAFAKYPNVYIKMPGPGEIYPRPVPAREPPFDDAIPPLIAKALEAFGPNRMMIGTDYPYISTREGYANVLRYLRGYVAKRPMKEQEAIMGKTAASLFRFGAR